MDKPEYARIAEQYRGALVLGEELAARSRSIAFDLERELREYAESNSPVLKDHYKDIPPYLRDLLWMCSMHHIKTTNGRPVPSNYIRLIQRLVASDPVHDVLFLVLNYDNLLEWALEWMLGMQFVHLSDYVSQPARPNVVKLHGSVNWFVPIGRSGSWDDAVRSLPDVGRVPKDKAFVDNSVTSVRMQHHTGSHLYPLLTAPLAGKGLAEMVCPQSHLEAAREFLTDCYKFLVIGSSLRDADLLDLLDSSKIPVGRVTVEVVGQGRDTGEAHARLTKGVRAFTRPGAEINQRDQGFEQYLEAVYLPDLLNQHQ